MLRSLPSPPAQPSPPALASPEPEHGILCHWAGINDLTSVLPSHCIRSLAFLFLALCLDHISFGATLGLQALPDGSSLDALVPVVSGHFGGNSWPAKGGKEEKRKEEEEARGK